MVKKKTQKKLKRGTSYKKKPEKKNTIPKEKVIQNHPTLKLKKERDIAMDFATKAYQRFDKIIKSIILFGSTVKQTQVSGSDIDIILLIDDMAINWDQELIGWYRTELEKLLKDNPYQINLHINTVKLSTWWEDLMRGDPLILNILRHGESIIDLAGFFNPLKALLIHGKIRSTPEAIYSALQRAPMHIARSKAAEMGAIEGLFWSMVDSSHAALIAANVPPVSPEHIPGDLKENFVDTGKLKMKYVVWYQDLLSLHKKISHEEIKDLRGVEIDAWQARAEEFLQVMANLVRTLIK
ncbi:nucleotidyltransferase domain-containing protein [Patescibacteria group bacterium]|nr:nucleotidyltransferase domain-containing protein [Patescibacteria group bacterium]